MRLESRLETGTCFAEQWHYFRLRDHLILQRPNVRRQRARDIVLRSRRTAIRAVRSHLLFRFIHSRGGTVFCSSADAFAIVASSLLHECEYQQNSASRESPDLPPRMLFLYLRV